MVLDLHQSFLMGFLEDSLLLMMLSGLGRVIYDAAAIYLRFSWDPFKILARFRNKKK